MAGYVKLFRSIEQWEWYTDVNTTKVFLHCLIKASRNDYRFKGIDLKKGQFPTSYEKLAKENGLSVSQVRTSIKKLILTGELTKVVTDEKTVITVVNWALYQSSEVNDDKDIDKEVDIAMTRESQGNDKGMTTTKNIRSKEVKELKKKNTRSPIPFGKYGNVKLTQEEYEKLGDRRDEYVSFLDSYMEEKPYKSKNHNLAIHRWVKQAVDERKGNGKNQKSQRVDVLPFYAQSEGITEEEKTELYATINQMKERELSDSDKQRIIEKMKNLGKEV